MTLIFSILCISLCNTLISVCVNTFTLTCGLESVLKPMVGVWGMETPGEPREDDVMTEYGEPPSPLNGEPRVLMGDGWGRPGLTVVLMTEGW